MTWHQFTEKLLDRFSDSDWQHTWYQLHGVLYHVWQLDKCQEWLTVESVKSYWQLSKMSEKMYSPWKVLLLQLLIVVAVVVAAVVAKCNSSCCCCRCCYCPLVETLSCWLGPSWSHVVRLKRYNSCKKSNDVMWDDVMWRAVNDATCCQWRDVLSMTRRAVNDMTFWYWTETLHNTPRLNSWILGVWSLRFLVLVFGSRTELPAVWCYELQLVVVC